MHLDKKKNKKKLLLISLYISIVFMGQNHLDVSEKCGALQWKDVCLSFIMLSGGRFKSHVITMCFVPLNLCTSALIKLDAGHVFTVWVIMYTEVKFISQQLAPICPQTSARKFKRSDFLCRTENTAGAGI